MSECEVRLRIVERKKINKMTYTQEPITETAIDRNIVGENLPENRNNVTREVFSMDEQEDEGEPAEGNVEEKEKKPISKFLDIWWPPIMLCGGILIYYLVLLNHQTLPTALNIVDEDPHRVQFIAEHAKRITDELSNFGPKVSGSDMNEVNAVSYIINEVEKIMSTAVPEYHIEYDIQKASGSFPIGSSLSVYQAIQNIVVRVIPRGASAQSSVLINSHFDSVPISYGAGDAILMCGVMLETMRAIVQHDLWLQHSFIFLFNGAEENGLLGSHAFIKHHQWAPYVKALINLDSCGTGGKEILFQSTNSAPWLIEMYKANAPHPFSIIIGQEIFDANLIPSDTDFRIFRDFGNVPGVDFAICSNGYIYHTKYDRPELIPPGTYQNMGDNILAMALAMANSDKLINPQLHASDERLVYFDYLGWFMISYTWTEAIIIHVIISTISISMILFFLRLVSEKLGKSLLSIACEFFTIIVWQLVTIIIGAIIVIALAYILDAVDRSMSWFSHPWLLFGLYGCPFLFILGLGPAIYLSVRNKFWTNKNESCETTSQENEEQDDVSKEPTLSYGIQMFLHAQNLIFIIICLTLTGLEIKTSFIIMMVIIFYTISSIVNLIAGLIHHDRIWILPHCVALVIPYLFVSYVSVLVFDIFVPIQGRGGSSSNPDLLISAACIAITLLLGSLIIPIFSMVRWKYITISIFLVIFVVFVILVATPIGFPFRAETSAQRFWIYHTERTYHDVNGNVRKSESGYIVRAMNRHLNNLVEEHVPQFQNATETSLECESELFCGIPMYSAGMIGEASSSHWVPAGKPIFEGPNAQLVHIPSPNDEISQNKRRYRFTLTGPDHMSIMISPKLNSWISNWSFPDDVIPNRTRWNGRLTYFIYFMYSVDNSTLDFSVDIETSMGFVPNPGIDIAVSAHWTHHDELRTDEFNGFLNSFPDWAHVTPWMSSYQNWEF